MNNLQQEKEYVPFRIRNEYGVGDCLTFEEAAKVLKFVLNNVDLKCYLERADYLYHGIPRPLYSDIGFFKLIYLDKENKSNPECLYFITQKGLTEIFKIALKEFVEGSNQIDSFYNR